MKLNFNGGTIMELRKTDPEFAERFQHFAFDEVVNEENKQLDAPTRYLAILSALIGWQRTALETFIPVPVWKRVSYSCGIAMFAVHWLSAQFKCHKWYSEGSGMIGGYDYGIHKLRKYGHSNL